MTIICKFQYILICKRIGNMFFINFFVLASIVFAMMKLVIVLNAFSTFRRTEVHIPKTVLKHCIWMINFYLFLSFWYRIGATKKTLIIKIEICKYKYRCVRKSDNLRKTCSGLVCSTDQKNNKKNNKSIRHAFRN